MNRFNYKRTQFRCYCLFFLASNKDTEDFLNPGQHQRMKGKVIPPANMLIEIVRRRLPGTFIEKVLTVSNMSRVCFKEVQ
jgi:hypothetical protein